MILNLVSSDDPILRQTIEPFDFRNPPTDPIQLAKDLYETMVTHKGLGLAAPQVGLPYRVFAMYAVPGIVCFNPRVVDYTATDFVTLDEGCLSFPNLFLKVKRPRKIKVRYYEPNGNPVTKVIDGMTARCFLHELDHLNGEVFTTKVNKFHLDRAIRKRMIYQRQQKNEARV